LPESNTLLLTGTGLVTVYVALRTAHRASRLGQKALYKLYGSLEGFFRKRATGHPAAQAYRMNLAGKTTQSPVTSMRKLPYEETRCTSKSA
jgi:hypothetical protein